MPAGGHAGRQQEEHMGSLRNFRICQEVLLQTIGRDPVVPNAGSLVSGGFVNAR